MRIANIRWEWWMDDVTSRTVRPLRVAATVSRELPRDMRVAGKNYLRLEVDGKMPFLMDPSTGWPRGHTCWPVHNMRADG